MVRVKYAIVLILVNWPIEQVAEIADDNRSTKELWDEIIKLLFRLEIQLEALQFDDGEPWGDFTGKINSISENISSYHSEIREEENMSNIIRAIPD